MTNDQYNNIKPNLFELAAVVVVVVVVVDLKIIVKSNKNEW